MKEKETQAKRLETKDKYHISSLTAVIQFNTC